MEGGLLAPWGGQPWTSGKRHCCCWCWCFIPVCCWCWCWYRRCRCFRCRCSPCASTAPPPHFPLSFPPQRTSLKTQAGYEYDQLTFVNMILGFARQARYADVLVMFRGLEALTAANTQNGVWTKRQKGYWGCYNEALKGCEVRSMRRFSMRMRCGGEGGVKVVLVCYLWVWGMREAGGGRVLSFVLGRSRMTIDPRIPTMPERSTSGFHQPGRGAGGGGTRRATGGAITRCSTGARWVLSCVFLKGCEVEPYEAFLLGGRRRRAGGGGARGRGRDARVNGWMLYLPACCMLASWSTHLSWLHDCCMSYMLAACLLHACFMFTTCLLHASCLLNVCFMIAECLVHACCMLAACLLCACCMLAVCLSCMLLYACCMLAVCVLNA